MTSDIVVPDDQPVLGSGFALPLVFSTFQSWAKKHGQLNIAHQLIGLCNEGISPDLIGGLLRFLSYLDTSQVLKAWSENSPAIGALANLASHLAVDFPDVPIPSNARSIKQQFARQLNFNYLYAQYSTRNAPGINGEQQLRMTCWRVWILIKALQLGTTGNIYDESLLDICANTRMALDEQGDTKRLNWFLSLVPPFAELNEFELALGEQVKRQPATGVAGAEIVLRGIKALLKDQHRPCTGGAPRPAIILQPGQWHTFDPRASATVQGTEPDLSNSDFSDRTFGDFVESEVQPDKTLPESVREARRIAFQSREDLHYLPYSWNRLRPDERKAMAKGIQSTLRGQPEGAKLIAALAVIAIVCRRSMETITSLALGSISVDEWQLDARMGVLHRLPARRNARWQATDAAEEWIKPLSSEWVLHLDDAIGDVLKSALMSNPDARAVSDLWIYPSKSMAASFNEWCKTTPGLDRVTSGFLVHTGEQVAFEETNDPVFALLVSSPARAGLPGSCAYPSWQQAAVAQALNKIGQQQVTMESITSLNSMGSELDPDDELLSHALGQAYSEVVELGSNRGAWIEYHNHLTSYALALLLASTGARPVESMFESSSHFNWEEALLYIEDKVVALGQDGRAGRIVPIPGTVRDFLTEIYLPYLAHLATSLQMRVPEMAREIQLQIDGIGSSKLPLFFYLRNRPDFQWIPVSESTFDSVKMAEWPLPLNLFRHRIATRLRELHLDPELIDAQLGHAQAGAETYGDYSLRCFSTDLPQWRAAIARCLEFLRPQYPPLIKLEIGGIEINGRSDLFPVHRSFGKDARTAQRKKHKTAVVKSALRDIREFVAGRILDTIAPDDWARLGRKMVLTEHNLRHANALIRYETFERYLQNKWRKTGQRPRLKKWITAQPAPRSVFHSDSVRVGERLERAREAFNIAFGNLRPPSTLARQEAAQFAALDLALSTGIACQKLLGGVTAIDKDALALVVFQRRLYIEYSQTRSWREGSPVVRFLVPTRSARLLEAAFSAKKTLPQNTQTPQSLKDFCSALELQWTADLSFEKLITTVAKHIDRENALIRPGAVAGILAGRVTSYALRHEDWIRTVTGKSRQNPAAMIQGPKRPEESPTLSVLKIPIGYVSRKRPDSNLSANRAFIADIRKALTDYKTGALEQKTDSQLAARRKKSNTETEARATTRSTIKSLVSRPDPQVSVACHALACWVLGLLSQKYKKDLLDAASILRYLNTLSPGFTQFGYDVDLADLDADELTEFYSQIVDPANAKEPGGDRDTQENASKKHEEAPGDSNPVARRPNGQYIIERLIKFHSFAKSKYGLEEPDWSELSDGLFASTALPGHITLAEYLHALDLICPAAATASPTQLQDALILLLTWRFGLRGGEAIALARSGWVDVEGAIIVVVDGSFRKLKTKGSSRQVPLLENLEEKEQAVIDRWLTHWDNQSLENPKIPLFFAHRVKGGIVEISAIRSRLIEAMRAVSGASHINLHHARHSFANRMGLHLLLQGGDTSWTEQSSASEGIAGHVKRTVLSTESPTRRAPWALARLLGHAGPQTTFNSYIHFLFDLLSQELIQSKPNLFEPLSGARLEGPLYLDDWALDDSYLRAAPLISSNPPQAICPTTVLEYMRLRANGRTPFAARDACDIAPADHLHIESALIAAGGRLTALRLAGSNVSDITLPMGLLGHIESKRWQELIDWVGSLGPPDCIFAGPGHHNPANQIGPTRQILLWEREQFDALKVFLNWCHWSSSDVLLYAPRGLDQDMQAWVQTLSLGNLLSTTSGNPASTNRVDGRKREAKSFQIDTVRVREYGHPEVTYPHRIAVVRSPHNDRVNDNFELIAVWLAFFTGQPTER